MSIGRSNAEPIRQGVRHSFGAFGKDIARGLAVRHDQGSQYMSGAFQKEVAVLGIESSPASFGPQKETAAPSASSAP